jgi:hypothetical protein
VLHLRTNLAGTLLAKLQNKTPEQLSDLEIESIKQVMAELHYILFGKTFIGSGDGWMITNDINTYLVQFFNTYLKGEINPTFDNCSEKHLHKM